jgi:hypothetical protein
VFDDLVAHCRTLAVDPEVWSGRDRLTGLCEIATVRALLDGAELGVLGTVDANQDYRLDGAVTAASWLAAHTQVSSATARDKVKAARAMRRLDRLRSAVDAGAVGFEHART